MMLAGMDDVKKKLETLLWFDEMIFSFWAESEWIIIIELNESSVNFLTTWTWIDKKDWGWIEVKLLNKISKQKLQDLAEGFLYNFQRLKQIAGDCTFQYPLSHAPK